MRREKGGREGGVRARRKKKVEREKREEGKGEREKREEKK